MSLPPILTRARIRGLVLVSLLTLLQGLAAGAAALATRQLFEALHAGSGLSPLAMGGLAGSGLVLAAARVQARVAGERLGQGYARDIRVALFEHAAGMAASDVATRRAGYMSLRFVGDMTAFRNWLALGLPRLIAGAILIPMALMVLWLMHPAFLAALAGPAIIAMGVLGMGGRRLVPRHRRLRARRARIAAEMAERMPLAPELDRLGRRPTECKRLDRRTSAMVRAALDRVRLAEALKALPDVLAGLAAVTILALGARLGLGTGTIAGALAALGLMLNPMRDLASVGNIFAAWQAARAKASAALGRPQRGGYGRRSLPKGPVDLRIRGLDLPSGRRLDLTAKPGAIRSLTLPEQDSAFVFAALARLEPAPEGAIALSGRPLSDLSRGSLRRNVARVGCDIAVMQGSLRSALTMGGPRRTDTELQARLARIGVDGILSLAGGVDARILEGGRNLSPSQRLAISLFRAAEQRPRLVLLDASLALATPVARKAVRDWLRRQDCTVLADAAADLHRREKVHVAE
ncbi:MAG: ABC transporter transmembrane domain-containing protein [Rhodovulum sp.]